MDEVADCLVRLIDDLGIAVGIVNADGSLFFANRIVQETLLRTGNQLCHDLQSLVDAARSDGLAHDGSVCDSGSTRPLWVGRVWPVGDRIAFVGRSPSSHTRVAHLVARLNVEPWEARLALNVAEGRSNRDLAALSRLPVGTVKSRLWALCRKLHVKNRVALAVLVHNAFADEQMIR